MQIKLSQVRPNPVALRGVDREGEQYQNLRRSIESKGLLNPINVREKTDKDTDETYYEICDGLHRYSSCVDLGIEDIEVHVVSLSDAETLEAQISANLCRVDTKPAEYSKQLHRMMMMNPTMTVSDVAEKVSQSPQWVSQRLNLLKLEDKVQELVDDGKINVSNAFTLSKLPKEEQGTFVDSAMTMPPAEFAPTVNKRVKELKEAARKGREANPVEWTPTPFMRKVKEFKDELEHGAQGPSVVAAVDATTAAEGFAAGIAWALHLDPAGVEEQKAKYEAREAAKAEAKKERDLERAEKKAKEAAEEAAKLAAAE